MIQTAWKAEGGTLTSLLRGHGVTYEMRVRTAGNGDWGWTAVPSAEGLKILRGGAASAVQAEQGCHRAARKALASYGSIRRAAGAPSGERVF